jgi:DNA-binding response OmpR family regulator
MPTTKKQVLCVEDDDATCELLKFMLPDYEVTTVGSMAEALSRVGSTRFDLYLLDRGLPDGSGIDLCRLIRISDSTTPIVFCSGAAALPDRMLVFEAGANAFLKKPEGLDQLNHTLNRLLGNDLHKVSEVMIG